MKSCDIAEAQTLQFLRNNTTISVPRIKSVWKVNGTGRYETAMIMEVVGGYELSEVWPRLSEMNKDWVIHQLRGYLDQLRALCPPKEGTVSPVCGGPLRDIPRVGLGQFGPFESHAAFHSFLCANCDIDLIPDSVEDKRKIVRLHGQQYVTKLTHVNFAPRNIMAERDGTITAIID